jgi:hypothetical protein
MTRHRPVSAADHPADIVAGCVGGDVSLGGNLTLEDI